MRDLYNLINYIKKPYIHPDVLKYISFILILSHNILLYFWNYFGIADYSFLYSIFTIYIPLLLYFSVNVGKLKKLIPFAFVFCFILMFFVLTLQIFPDYDVWFFRERYGIWDTIFRPDSGSIYFLLAVLLLDKASEIRLALKFVGIAWFLDCALRVFFMLRDGYWSTIDYTGEVVDSVYNLGFGYEAATLIALFIYLMINNNNKLEKLIYLICSIITLVWMLLYGSRGALIVVFMSILLSIGYFVEKYSRITKISIFICALIVTLLILMFYEEMFIFILGLLDKSNFDSRTLAMLFDGMIMSDNGRADIQERALELISKQSLFGSGALGDRQAIAPYYYWGYSHNIILEFIIDFGVILGPIFLVLLGFAIYKSYSSCSQWDSCGLYIFAISCCCKLLLSDSFWEYHMFWFLIGLLLKKIKVFE